MPATLASVASIIQTILAPAVMISACGLLLLGMQNKYGRIIDRLRSLARERLELIPQRGEPLANARLTLIDRQLPDLMLRLRKQQSAVLGLFRAVAIFVADGFLIAGGLLLAPGIGNALALAAFLLGMGFVFWSVVQAATEIRISTRAVTYEVEECRKL
jgi:hypothetical protein